MAVQDLPSFIYGDKEKNVSGGVVYKLLYYVQHETFLQLAT